MSGCHQPEQYKINELEDMKQGIEYLYEFRNKLSVVQDVIECMLIKYFSKL